MFTIKRILITLLLLISLTGCTKDTQQDSKVEEDYSIDGYVASKVGEFLFYRNTVQYDEHDFIMLEGKSLIRFNHKGEIVWRYEGDATGYLNHFTVDSNNNIVVSGNAKGEEPFDFVRVISPDGEVIKTIDLSKTNLDSITNINVYKDGYLLNVSNGFNNNYIAYVDEDFNTIWSTDYDVNYPMVFVRIDDLNNIKMFFLDSFNGYSIVEVNSKGEIQGSRSSSGGTVLSRLDILISEYKLETGEIPTKINIVSNAGYTIENDSNEFLKINAIIALPDGGYNLYGESATRNSENNNKALMWRFNANLEYTDFEVIDVHSTKFVDALITKEGDFLTIAYTRVADGIFMDSDTGVNTYYLIIKDDDKLDFDD